jgi:hypothetical protein
VSIWEPFLKILYPVTPTLSVEAVQEKDSVVDAVVVLVRPVGTDGGVVSEEPDEVVVA